MAKKVLLCGVQWQVVGNAINLHGYLHVGEVPRVDRRQLHEVLPPACQISRVKQEVRVCCGANDRIDDRCRRVVNDDTVDCRWG